MAVIAALSRIFSYLFHTLLALFLLGVALVSLLSGGHNLRMAMLPWTGAQLTWSLVASSLFGLICVVTAMLGKVRPLYFLYTAAVFVMIVRGYFVSGYTFGTQDEFRFALYLSGGALLAMLGGWWQWRRKRR
ncbi:MAG: hypothetical protein ABIZ80_19625 [Bryobacteraceae bacterium]